MSKSESDTEPDSDRIRIDDLQNSIEALQSELDQLREQVDNLPTHASKLGRADEMSFDIGDKRVAVVHDDGSGTSHGDPLVKIDGVATFLSQGPNMEIESGDTVEVVISEKSDSHAKGVITEVKPDE